MIIVAGILYVFLWVVSYIPFLFVAIKKWELTIQTERVLFFLPTGIATFIILFSNLSFPEFSFPEINAQIGALIFAPNFILQMLFYKAYIKRIRS